MKRLLFTGLALCTSLLALSQVQTKPKLNKNAEFVNTISKSEEKTAELLKFRKPTATEAKWKTKIVNIHSPKEYSPEVGQQKMVKDSIKATAELGIGNDGSYTRRAFDPKIGTNFEGNELRNVTPPDNTIAVSTDGYVVSVDNYSIEYYKTDGTILLSRESHTDFFNDATLTGSIFDPRVIYDPIEDKFIYVILHGSSPETSKLLVSFSKSSNPQDGWYIYPLDVSSIVNNDGTWFDYPSIGISTNELYISGNMFRPNGNNNQFEQSILLQMEKGPCFTGGTLKYQTWTGIKAANGTNAFTLKPLSFGHNSSYGPGIYLVSNYSGGSSNGNIFVYNLTDDMSASDEELKSYQFNISGGYDIAGDASQKGTTDKIKTGNCRIQRGFYLDGILHFVFNEEYASGYSGINYCRIDIANNKIESKSFGLTGYDYAFPSIASFSSDEKDKSVLIHFLRTGSTIYPESRIMTFDNQMNASNSVLVKAGETYVSIISGSERWGDYSGIARKYGSAEPEIWVAGCYGVKNYRTNNGFNAWIAQVSPAFGVGIEETVKPTIKTSVYPNPVEDLFEMEIDMPESGKVEISILDITGKVVKVLFQDKLKPGINDLTFNKNALQAGTYIVQVLGDNIKSNTKIIIE